MSCRSVIKSRRHHRARGNHPKQCHNNSSSSSSSSSDISNNRDNVVVEDGEHEDPRRVVVGDESRQTPERRVRVAAAMCVFDAINRDITRMLAQTAMLPVATTAQILECVTDAINPDTLPMLVRIMEAFKSPRNWEFEF